MSQISDLNQTKIKVISLANELIDDLQGETDKEAVEMLNRLIDIVSQFTHKPPPGGKGYDDVFDEFEETRKRIIEEKERKEADEKTDEWVVKQINELLKEIENI